MFWKYFHKTEKNFLFTFKESAAICRPKKKKKKSQIQAVWEMQHRLGITPSPSNFKRPSVFTSWSAMPTNSFTS